MTPGFSWLSLPGSRGALGKFANGFSSNDRPKLRLGPAVPGLRWGGRVPTSSSEAAPGDLDSELARFQLARRLLIVMSRRRIGI
jgi:hypothetical protein